MGNADHPASWNVRYPCGHQFCLGLTGTPFAQQLALRDLERAGCPRCAGRPEPIPTDWCVELDRFLDLVVPQIVHEAMTMQQWQTLRDHPDARAVRAGQER